ncbi:hypothetical protein OQA88_2474 [Cercophora sp. LCS_1]
MEFVATAKPIGFLDFPGEIQNQILDDLLEGYESALFGMASKGICIPKVPDHPRHAPVFSSWQYINWSGHKTRSALIKKRHKGLGAALALSTTCRTLHELCISHIYGRIALFSAFGMRSALWLTKHPVSSRWLRRIYLQLNLERELQFRLDCEKYYDYEGWQKFFKLLPTAAPYLESIRIATGEHYKWITAAHQASTPSNYYGSNKLPMLKRNVWSWMDPPCIKVPLDVLFRLSSSPTKNIWTNIGITTSGEHVGLSASEDGTLEVDTLGDSLLKRIEVFFPPAFQHEHASALRQLLDPRVNHPDKRFAAIKFITEWEIARRLFHDDILPALTSLKELHQVVIWDVSRDVSDRKYVDALKKVGIESVEFGTRGECQYEIDGYVIGLSNEECLDCQNMQVADERFASLYEYLR